MARTIEAIQQSMNDSLSGRFPNLTVSRMGEWRLWTRVAAGAIQSFEIILDLFRAEVESKISKMTSGTEQWYIEISKRFQFGHKLVFDKETATYYYEVIEEAAQIIKVVAVVSGEKRMTLKVAKQDEDGRIVALSDMERFDFTDYIDTLSLPGIQTDVISTTADSILYDIEVYYDPGAPSSSVKAAVEEVISQFKTSLIFNARFYPRRLLDKIMDAPGVVTVNFATIMHKTSVEAEYAPVGVMVTLGAGYFEYAGDSKITMISIRQ